MAVHHHASDELLLAYAAGRLSAAPALVLASHLAMSSEAANRLAGFDQLGGALLEEQPMVDVTAELFERTLARLDEKTPLKPIPPRPDHRRLDLGVALPTPLAMRRIGGWRLIAPGIRFARVDVPEDPAFKVVLLRVGAGKALPQHGHSASELTLILKGRFGDEVSTYGPGDLEEEDMRSNHQPTVGGDSECICVTAIEGRLVPSGWLAKIMMPLLGF